MLPGLLHIAIVAHQTKPLVLSFPEISSARNFNPNNGLVLLLLLKIDNPNHCEGRSNRYVCC